jgi:hypothetical protein
VPLQDFVGRFDSGFNLGVESLALDPNDPTRVYLAVGEYTESYGTNGYILSSSNMGNTFTALALPFKNGSNDNGRFAGERLSVDPANGWHIYFGTRGNGLYESNDQAAGFNQVSSFPVTGTTGTTTDPGAGIIFEDFLTTSGMANGNTKTIYFGVSDPKTGLYVSNDGGKTAHRLLSQRKRLRSKQPVSLYKLRLTDWLYFELHQCRPAECQRRPDMALRVAHNPGAERRLDKHHSAHNRQRGIRLQQHRRRRQPSRYRHDDNAEQVLPATLRRCLPLS